MRSKLMTFLICFSFIAAITGCSYHKADIEYPQAQCDTAIVRFGVEIKAILDANCKECHYEGNDISKINLYNWPTIHSLATDGNFVRGTLLTAVLQTGEVTPMPKGRPKISDCEINKIRAWVNKGAPEN